MKKFIIITAVAMAFVFCGSRANAQEVKDTVIYHIASAVDSSLVGTSVLDIMPAKSKGDAADINISQSHSTIERLNNYILRNKERVMSGYRVRIFFDNKQSARAASESAMETFNKNYHGIPAYRSYQSPFFKVTVGDFRTKSEAMVLLKSLKNLFPSAFIVKENINYPAADREHTFVADTVRTTLVEL